MTEELIYLVIPLPKRFQVSILQRIRGMRVLLVVFYLNKAFFFQSDVHPVLQKYLPELPVST